MKFITFLSRSLLVFGILFLQTLYIYAQGVGIHYTAAEVSIWRQRAEKGPYKSQGDVSANSPGDWDRILKNANSFLSNPSAERWVGYTGGGCFPQAYNGQYDPNSEGQKLRDAAFAYLITQDNRYSDAVRKELMVQASEKLTDFSNTSRWCPGVLADINPSFYIAGWLNRLLFAYDYTKDAMTQQEREKLDKWFRDAATYMQTNVDPPLDKMFVNRAGGNYTLTTQGKSKLKEQHALWYGGPKYMSIGTMYNNRRSAMAMFVTAVGVMQNNASFKATGRNFAKEFIMFATLPSGDITELYRWTTDFPDKGLGYAYVSMGHIVAMADFLARAGDKSVYDFRTSMGYGPYQGGNKSLLLIMQTALKYMDGTIGKRYATADKNKVGNSAYLIDGSDESRNWHMASEVFFAQANVNYKDEYVRKGYLKTNPGQRPYAPKPAGIGGESPYNGPIGSQFPAMLFLFGQMEGKVNPYGNTTPPAPAQNQAPTANAGEDKIINLPTNTVTLGGSGTDKDGSITSYSWTKVSGPEVTLSGNSTPTLIVSNLSVGTYAFALTVKDNKGSTATDQVTVTVNPLNNPPTGGSGNSPVTPGTGKITSELWSNIQGNQVLDIPVSKTPDRITELTLFEAPGNIGVNYGQRIRGYVTAPTSGQYTFWIAADDNAELWLSTDHNPSNKQKIAFISFWTESRQWDKFPSQKSVTVRLEAGKKYYIEALQKQGTGGDNLAVGWQLPSGAMERPIPGNRISTYETSSPAPKPSTPVGKNAVAAGYIMRELWKNIGGESVSEIPVNTAADESSKLTSFASPYHIGDHYGSRIRGYIHAPTTGDYTFWAAGDNSVEVWISSDDDPVNKKRIISFTGSTLARQWDKYGEQKSNTIRLEAKKRYYIEVLHKELAGGDHVALGWQLPDGTLERPIEGKHLSPYASSITEAASNQQQLNLQVEEAESVRVYPNPFKNNIAMEVPEAWGKLINVSILNYSGEEVYRDDKPAPSESGSLRYDFDFANQQLKEGIHVLKLTFENGSQQTIRIMKE